MRLALAALLVLLGLPSVATAVPETWPSPETRENLARELVGRTISVLDETSDRQSLLVSARTLVRAVGERLRRRGEDDVIANAPILIVLEIPSAGDPALDAMSRYQACNLVLAMDLGRLAEVEDQEARLSTLFGMTAVSMAILYLRHSFLLRGGDPDRVEEHLSGPVIEEIFQILRTDSQRMHWTTHRCEPAVLELLRDRP